MKNKGAIRLFAILLALACAYYLMFTWVAAGIESDAEEFAKNYVSGPEAAEAAEKESDNATDQKTHLDFLFNAKKNYYLDSLKKKPVYDIFIAQYTYEEVKKRQLNLGLDLKGGMNVTLEVSVAEIIRGLSNNSNDPTFTKALSQAIERQKKDPKSFVIIFGEEFKKINPNAKLAINFQTIELKGKIDFNTPDAEVLKFLQERVEDAIATSENTLRARIDKFGVTQPNIQRLASSGRILIELPGVTDKKRVRKLLQGTANLEFWETFDNKDIYPLLEQANTRLKEILSPAADSAKDDSVAIADVKTSEVKPSKIIAKDDSTSTSLSAQLGTSSDTTKKIGETKADTMARLRKENPLFAVLSPSIGRDDKGQSTLGMGPVIGYAAIADTGKINAYFRMQKIKSIFKPYTRFFWTFKAVDKEETTVQLVAIDGSRERGKAALSGDIITEARKVFDQQGSGSPQISMSMTSDAAIAWKHLTKDNIGKSIAIVLDNSVYSFPTVQGEIAGGTSSITGNFSIEEADDLINILKAGKLPAPARIVEESVVGPTLGAEAVSKGLFSTIIALILVLLFMGFYYSKAGWVADLAMIINNLFVVGILASFGAVLTLPGIAGIVLSRAMSVDANILIFERVRE
ncbi:MAG: protein translocase subunit SecD, partial [Bacteroidetes bacterium]|nr:protein translocase subunit SecD [Bacteroidota bacterium]